MVATAVLSLSTVGVHGAGASTMTGSVRRRHESTCRSRPILHTPRRSVGFPRRRHLRPQRPWAPSLSM
eukprot:4497240-Lingulodinium_polyedra.AAC.1